MLTGLLSTQPTPPTAPVLALPVGGDDNGLARLAGSRDGALEQAPGHGVHASGRLVQEDNRGLSKQGNVGAQLPLVATAGAEGEKLGNWQF